jgi:hypothetical protein
VSSPLRVSFDSDAIDQTGNQVNAAASALAEATAAVAGIGGWELPDPVPHQLDALKKHARDIISDITDEASALATQLRRVADAYADLENSIVRAFQGPG